MASMAICARYNIYPIKENAPDPLTRDWVDHLKEGVKPILKGKEESECCVRTCCPRYRNFAMPFHNVQVDGSLKAPGDPDRTAFTLERPYRCTCNCCCCMLSPQEMLLRDGAGKIVAHAVEARLLAVLLI